MNRKNISIAGWMMAAGTLAIFAGCSKDADEPFPEPNGTDGTRYALLMADPSDDKRAGAVAVLDSFPAGDLVIGDVLFEGSGMAAWKPYKNWMFKSFSTADYSRGVERLVYGSDGRIMTDGSIKVAGSAPGSGNFVIAADTLGYFWDAASPLKIKKFNPSKMIESGEIDLADALKEIDADTSAIKFKAVGQKLLAVKEGKLFANITLAKTDGDTKGVSDDFFADTYLAVVDIASSKWEKNTVVKDAGAIGSIDDNPMYSADGDLYMICETGSPNENSKIVRIKRGTTDVDSTWSLDAGEIVKNSGTKFAAVYAKENHLIVSVNNTPVTGSGAADIWEYYSVDVASKGATRISGIPAATRPDAGAIEVDNRVLLRAVTTDKSANGLYELSGTEAKSVFQLKGGRTVQGLVRLK